MEGHAPIDSPRETRWLLRSLVLGFALSVTALVLWIVVAEPHNPWQIAGQTLGFLSVPGKYVVFWGLAPSSPLGPWGLTVVGIVADLLLTLLLTSLLQPLGRLRGVGPWLKRVHERAAEVLSEYPGLRRTAFWGVALFVFLPLPGTGAVGGTFAGQLLGLSRTATVLAVLAGSAGTLLVFASFATFLGAQAQEILENPWVALAAGLAFALFVWLAYRRVKRSLSS